MLFDYILSLPAVWMEGIRTLMEFGELSRAATLIIQAPLRKVVSAVLCNMG